MPEIPKPHNAPEESDRNSWGWAGEPDLAAVFALLGALGLGAVAFLLLDLVAHH